MATFVLVALLYPRKRGAEQPQHMQFTVERQAELDEIRAYAKRRRLQQLREHFGSQNVSCSSSNSSSSQSQPVSPRAATPAATATAASVIRGGGDPNGSSGGTKASAEAEISMDPLELDLLACSRPGASVPFCFAYLAQAARQSSKLQDTK